MKFSKKEELLKQKDQKLKKIIDKNGHIVFKPNKSNEFNNLVKIVISQFISNSAANSIFIKIKNNFNAEYLNERHFKDLSVMEIKKLGLSLNKAKTIKELSELYLDETFENFSNLNENNYRERMISIFGIGPWSVNMFEIFCIGKMNIFSSKDKGLRIAMNNFGMIKPESDLKKYDEYAEKWHPYKTIASLHLWKTVD